MFISELEKKTGLTRHTIRFYEKEGFLENYIRRGENNYRDYSEDAVVLLLNIKAGQAAGVLRIDFPGYSGERSLKPVSWEEWFNTFEDRQLAFLYQDRTASGKTSRFNKLVQRCECC